MRVHHLNCASFHPIGGPLARHDAGRPAHMVCHCLLIEAPDGLVLVDSGFGTGDLAAPRQRIGGLLLRVGRPALEPAETALRQVRALGYRPEDVRHILLTHLDLDHAGGIGDFPQARVHLMAGEHAAATGAGDWLSRSRYRPAQWAHGPLWETYDLSGEPWMGFDAVRDLRGLPPEILLVPLRGHTEGHAAIAVQTETGWLLHAGDAYFHRGVVHEGDPEAPVGLRLFQRVTDTDRDARVENQRRLRALASQHGDEVTVFCAHDPVEWERLQE
ncbi:MAG: MBL fold metallo-hydrolase [Deltaproteobacteria bacterium]|nr:MBL fold metallo-hydrolase [Deltaproteobacteria bacterium]